MNQENGVAGNIPAQNQPPVRPMKVTLSPIPPNSTTITHIASICRGSKKRAPIEDVVECFKLKILQIEEESKSKIRSISFIGNRNDRIRLLNLKLSFNKLCWSRTFPWWRGASLSEESCSSGWGRSSQRSSMGWRSAKWKLMNESRRLKLGLKKLGPSMKLWWSGFLGQRFLVLHSFMRLFYAFLFLIIVLLYKLILSIVTPFELLRKMLFISAYVITFNILRKPS